MLDQNLFGPGDVGGRALVVLGAGIVVAALGMANGIRGVLAGSATPLPPSPLLQWIAFGLGIVVLLVTDRIWDPPTAGSAATARVVPALAPASARVAGGPVLFRLEDARGQNADRFTVVVRLADVPEGRDDLPYGLPARGSLRIGSTSVSRAEYLDEKLEPFGARPVPERRHRRPCGHTARVDPRPAFASGGPHGHHAHRPEQ